MNTIVLIRLSLIYFIFILGVSIIVEWVTMKTSPHSYKDSSKLLEYKLDKILEDIKQEMKREYIKKINNSVEHFSDYSPSGQLSELLQIDKDAEQQKYFHSAGRIPLSLPGYPLESLTENVNDPINSETLYKKFETIERSNNWQENYDIVKELQPMTKETNSYRIDNKYDYTLKSGKAPDSFFSLPSTSSLPPVKDLEDKFSPTKYKVQPVDDYADSSIRYI